MVQKTMFKRALSLVLVACVVGCDRPNAASRSQVARDSTAVPISFRPIFRNERTGLRVYCVNDDSKASDFILQNVPANVVSLPSAPNQREEVLNKGTWLVAVCALWSMDDIRAVSTAVDAATVLGPRINVGIRPFVDYDEIKTWCPEFATHGSTPHWLVLVDGEFRGQAIGTLDTNAVVAFVNRTLAAPSTAPASETLESIAK
ncbi:MAG: hypothetical protein AB7U73_14325 [Pirellulales bacterium]